MPAEADTGSFQRTHAALLRTRPCRCRALRCLALPEQYLAAHCLYETSLCLCITLRRIAYTIPSDTMLCRYNAALCLHWTTQYPAFTVRTYAVPCLHTAAPRPALPEQCLASLCPQRRCTSPCPSVARLSLHGASPCPTLPSPRNAILCRRVAVWRPALAVLNQTGLHETLPARCRVLTCPANA